MLSRVSPRHKIHYLFKRFNILLKYHVSYLLHIIYVNFILRENYFNKFE